MCKITIFILLLNIISVLCIPLRSQNIDIDILKRMNQNSSPFAHDCAVVLSNSTYATVMAVPAIIGGVALIKKDDAMLKDALYIGSSLAVTTAFTMGMKYTIGRQRPYEKYPGMLYTPYVENTPSLPSGHTSTAFSTATSLSLTYPKWYVIAPSYVWACSVGYSRMNLGVHYPTDVLAGALLGAGSAYLTYKANEWFWKKLSNRKLIVSETFL